MLSSKKEIPLYTAIKLNDVLLLITIVRKKNEKLIKLLEKQLDYNDHSFLGIADKRRLIQKLNELKGCSSTEHLLYTPSHDYMNPSLENLGLVLQKNKNRAAYCLHCPRVRRMLLNDKKWLHISHQTLNQSHTFMVFV
jgi:hypothetical protein